uniref:Uncharacterized protein n=1 Tax=Anopheles melas TaxID=34690 RepID=A0A182UDN6_9DIPT
MFPRHLRHGNEQRRAVLLRVQVHAAALYGLQHHGDGLREGHQIDDERFGIFAHHLAQLLQLIVFALVRDAQRFDRPGGGPEREIFHVIVLHAGEAFFHLRSQPVQIDQAAELLLCRTVGGGWSFAAVRLATGAAGSSHRTGRSAVQMDRFVKARTMVLPFDSSADIAKMEASVDRCGKQVANQQADKTRWQERFRQSLRSRNALRKEIVQSELATVLKGILTGKDAEIEALQATLYKEHVLQMSFTYAQENKLWHNIMVLSGDIIQQNYLLLRSMDRLDNVTYDKLKRLVKLNQRQRGVTFFDDDCQQQDRNNIDLSSNSLDDIANLSDCSEDAVDFPPDGEDEDGSTMLSVVGGAAGGAMKRSKLNDGSESEPETCSLQGDSANEDTATDRNIFKKPKMVSRTMSFKTTSSVGGGILSRPPISRRTPTKQAKATGKTTATTTATVSHRLKVPRLVVSQAMMDSLSKKKVPQSPSGDIADKNKLNVSDDSSGIGSIANSTFDICGSKDSETESLFSNVLVESNVDPQVLDKVLRRASMKGGKMTLSVSKENRKKSPKRIGKSPRTVNRSTSRTNSSASSVINRYRMMKAKDGQASTSGGTSAALPKPRAANNNFDSDSDRNRHNRLMGIVKK